MGRLENKRAIVTGGSQGQGAAIVRAFLAEGAKVAIADIAVEAGEQLTAELQKEYGDNVYFQRHDISDPDSWEALITGFGEKYGPVNVLANNAG
ncbi:MAG TPA: SDR family NAD(P)-dependent oxidoreductase, partial [Marmoricola sp.]|nr:SDR family NAD(P)-dependent oxidoreductase [Marmoricola sp.]